MAVETIVEHVNPTGTASVVTGKHGSVWVSSVSDLPGLDETMVFASDADGNVTDWIELYVTKPRNHTKGVAWAIDHVDRDLELEAPRA